MFIKQDKFHQNEKKIQELEVLLESQSREIEAFLKENDIQIEQIEAYVNDPSNFSPGDWAILEEEKGKMEKRLSSLLEKPPIKKKPPSPFPIGNHWIPVR